MFGLSGSSHANPYFLLKKICTIYQFPRSSGIYVGIINSGGGTFQTKRCWMALEILPGAIYYASCILVCINVSLTPLMAYVKHKQAPGFIRLDPKLWRKFEKLISLDPTVKTNHPVMRYCWEIGVGKKRPRESEVVLRIFIIRWA